MDNADIRSLLKRVRPVSSSGRTDMPVPLELGRWYWMRGDGPRKLLEIHPNGVRMEGITGYLTWFDPNNVMHEVTLEMWQTYRDQMESRGLAPSQWPAESYPDPKENT